MKFVFWRLTELCIKFWITTHLPFFIYKALRIILDFSCCTFCNECWIVLPILFSCIHCNLRTTHYSVIGVDAYVTRCVTVGCDACDAGVDSGMRRVWRRGWQRGVPLVVWQTEEWLHSIGRRNSCHRLFGINSANIKNSHVWFLYGQ